MKPEKSKRIENKLQVNNSIKIRTQVVMRIKSKLNEGKYLLTDK